MMNYFRVALVLCVALLWSAPIEAMLHGSISTCTQGSSFADGCATAPSGAASASAFFTNGAAGGTGHSYGTRPPWNVANVDFRAGYPTNITLKDPASGGFPACVSSTASHTVTIASAPCLITGYDFSLENGWQITTSAGCTSGTVTITNNNFAVGTNFGAGAGEVVNIGSGCSLDMENNTVDGVGCSFTTNSALIVVSGTGTSVFKYNQFINAAQHGISLQNSGTGNSFTSQYNYYRGFSFGAGNHGNPFIFNTSASYTTAISSYDVTVTIGTAGDPSANGLCPANSAIGGTSTAVQYFSPNTGSTLAGVSTDHSVVVDLGVSQAGAASFLFVMNGGTISSPVISTNYYDTTGIFTAGSPYNLSNATTPSISGNLLLSNGHACNANGSCS